GRGGLRICHRQSFSYWMYSLLWAMVGFPPAPRRMRWWFFLVRGAPFSVAHQSRSVIGGLLRLESIAIPVRVYFMNKIRVNLAHFAIGFISHDHAWRTVCAVFAPADRRRGAAVLRQSLGNIISRNSDTMVQQVVCQPLGKAPGLRVCPLRVDNQADHLFS